jgi:hypothetical protein
MVWTITLWFKEVEKPTSLQSAGKAAMTTQMKAWFALTIQVNSPTKYFLFIGDQEPWDRSY